MSPSDEISLEAIDRLRAELDKESERGAVLVAAAQLDERLADLIRSRLLPSPDEKNPDRDNLIGNRAPAYTFSARIDLAHRIGLISKKFWRDLHTIREIRNRVAHRSRACSFADVDLNDMIQALVARQPMVANDGLTSTRERFEVAVSWMFFYLDRHVGRLPRVLEPPDEFGYEDTPT